MKNPLESLLSVIRPQKQKEIVSKVVKKPETVGKMVFAWKFACECGTRNAFISETGYIIEVGDNQQPVKENLITDNNGSFKNLYFVEEARNSIDENAKGGITDVAKLAIAKAHQGQFHGGDNTTIVGLLGFDIKRDMAHLDDSIVSMSATSKSRSPYSPQPAGSRLHAGSVRKPYNF